MENLSFDKEALLDRFDNPEFAMAYGSGVFEQNGYEKNAKPMIDFILATKNTRKWHANNLKANPEDYNVLARLYRSFFVKLIEQIGPKIYYNPYADFEGRDIKYGMTPTDALIKDLTEWTHLYAAGRLQKPVEILSTTPEIQAAMDRNLEQALLVALTMLPENFTDIQLFKAITRLSYMGDVRNLVGGENPNKVSNIVEKNPDGFRGLYRKVIEGNSGIITTLNDGLMERDISPNAAQQIHEKMPINVQRGVDCPECWEDMPKFAKQTRNRVKGIVRIPSVLQPLSGVMGMDPLRAIQYAKEKLEKGRRAA